jgi:hypothetical protein
MHVSLVGQNLVCHWLHKARQVPMDNKLQFSLEIRHLKHGLMTETWWNGTYY